MTEKTPDGAIEPWRTGLSKVPAVTVWFWMIKVLCTTVGESFADWINMTLGVGLTTTAAIFTAILVAVLAWQLRLTRYLPSVYWLCVVVLSVTGTLYTDILTDDLHVRLVLTTSVFATTLAVVFGIWYAREQTLSIHSIVTLPRESFYWLAVLVTFALGTAAGDWMLQLTGWPAGMSVLLPAGLIAAIVIGWRLGANAVLSFWLAFILTRPLGANLGDWLASPTTDHGVGLGTAVTSAIFVTAILAVVIYLTVSHRDVMEDHQREDISAATSNPTRELVMHGYYVAVAVSTALLLVLAANRPHASAAGEEEGSASPGLATLSPGEASSHFPATEIAKFHTIAEDTLAKVRAGDHAAATARVKDLETAWDDDESSLRLMDETGWLALDADIDRVLEAVRASQPDPETETRVLTALVNALR